MTERIPPHDAQAEACVLSACLIDPRVIPEAREILGHPEAFYGAGHRAIWEAVLRLDDAGSTIDAATVAADLRSADKLEQVGGTVRLAQLLDETPAVVNVAAHAGIVADHYRRRVIVAEAQRIAAEGYGDTGPVADWAADVAGRMASAADASRRAETVYLASEATSETWSAMTKPGETLAAAVPTGIPCLDARLGGGFRPGRMYIAAGRPGMGKTAFALSVALNVATAGMGVVFVSAEMPRQDLMIRAIAQSGRLDTGALESGALSPDGWVTAAAAAERVGALPLAIDDRSPQTIASLRVGVRRAIAKLRVRFGASLKLGLVAVDYVQILQGVRRRGESRENEVGELSRGVMWLCRELDVPVLLLSQLNRDKSRRGWKSYRLDDLRDTGSLEQDAFGVLFVHRNDVEEPDESRHDGAAHIVVKKLRQGGTCGVERIAFHARSTRFYEDPRLRWSAAEREANDASTDLGEDFDEAS